MLTIRTEKDVIQLLARAYEIILSWPDPEEAGDTEIDNSNQGQGLSQEEDNLALA